MVSATFALMCRLHDEGRDHIWGYYVRNLARPLWLAQAANNVDVLVGNPPWLAYRFMPAAMQATFKGLSDSRNLWAGAASAPHQDLSALFVTRCAELYLRRGGRFGFVMPLAALSRRQFAGFRAGRHRASLAFGQPWDLHAVTPSFFPPRVRCLRPAGRGQQAADDATRGVGRPGPGGQRLPRCRRALPHPGGNGCPRPASDGDIAVCGAVRQRRHDLPQGPARGRAAGHRPRGRSWPPEKRPWRDMPALEGVVETQFIRPLLQGDSVTPYRLRAPRLAVIPWDGSRLLSGLDDQLLDYPGLARWWRQAEQAWNAHRASDRLSLAGQLDFRRKLSQQFPLPRASRRLQRQWHVPHRRARR